MNRTPLFVVLSPVPNAQAWVERCVESVRRQTYRNLRRLWVDDASSDGTSEILKGTVPVEDLLLSSERRSPSYNINKALTNHVREDCLIGMLGGDD